MKFKFMLDSVENFLCYISTINIIKNISSDSRIVILITVVSLLVGTGENSDTAAVQALEYKNKANMLLLTFLGIIFILPIIVMFLRAQRGKSIL